MRVLLGELFEVAGSGIFLAGSGLLAVADARTQLIPSRWLYPCAWATAGLLVCAAAVAVFLLLHRFSGMGMGDVRLAGLLALFLGWFSPLIAVAGVALGILVGGLVGVLLLVFRRADRQTMVPFGTCLVAGSWLALLTVAARGM